MPHPYIPNSAASARAEMLEALGIGDILELYSAIPRELILDRALDLPEPIHSEHELRRHMKALLERNTHCESHVSFLGGGCWQHFVPSICDEIVRRGELLTSYGGDVHSDHGKYQIFFEYASLLGELLDMDAVALSTYDWGAAAATSLLMAGRITNRSEVLIPLNMAPDRRKIIEGYCAPHVTVGHVAASEKGDLDLEHLNSVLSEKTAAVYIENPAYLGFLETQVSEIAALVRAHGTQFIVGVDPSSLGVLHPPRAYGADIVCGDLQPLGVHMEAGGGLAGFIATPDDPAYVSAYPSYLIGLTTTSVASELGFGLVDWGRTIYMRREDGNEFTGTATSLSAIAAAVYLTLMGPVGMQELGEQILLRSHYCAHLLAQLPNVSAPYLRSPFFGELVVSFGEGWPPLATINESLLTGGIFGGLDLSKDFPYLPNAALYSVSEIHTEVDLEMLASALYDTWTTFGSGGSA